MISIHTPTKGATLNFLFNSGVAVFQSTLPRRERLYYDSERFILIEFQSTLPRRERRSNASCSRSCRKFQSTLPRRERQYMKYVSLFEIPISIHTPTKGATAILTNNFLIFCSISLINFILYLKIIQILFIFRYKFIFYFIF